MKLLALRQSLLWQLHGFHRCSIICNQAVQTDAVKKAEELINDQLTFNVELPKSKTWSKTAVLQTLADTVENVWALRRQELETPYYWFNKQYPRNSKQNLRRSGRASANYVIENYSSLFQHDWDADSIEKWIDNQNETIHQIDDRSEPVDEENTDSLQNEELSIKSFRNLLSNKQVDSAVDAFSELLANKAAIPQDLINQFFGMVSFYKGSSSFMQFIDEDYTVATGIRFTAAKFDASCTPIAVENVYSSKELSLSLDQQSTEILSLCHMNKDDCLKALSIYKDKFKDQKLDIAVYNHLLLCLSNTGITGKPKIAQDILQVLKKHGIKPNYDTFVYFSLIPPSPEHLKSEKALLNYFEKIICEMKEVGVEPGPALCYSFMNVAVKNQHLHNYTMVMSSLMDYILIENSAYCQHPLDIAGFCDMMHLCQRNLTLAKKLFNITQKLNYHTILSSNLQKASAFYTKFLFGVAEKDTVDNLFYYIRQIVPHKLTLDYGLQNFIYARLNEDKQPQYLPILLLYMHRPRKSYYDGLDKWLQVALASLHLADADTKLQFKHIVMLEIKFCRTFTRDPRFDKVMNKCLKLLLASTDDFKDVAMSCETLLRVADEINIGSRTLADLKTLGCRSKKEIQVERLLKKFEMKKATLQKPQHSSRSRSNSSNRDDIFS